MKKKRLGLILIACVLTATAIGLIYTPYDPADISILDRLQPPSHEHWLGTDNFGRDVLSRVVVGGRWSLFVGGAAVLVGLVVGVFLGIVAGFMGRTWDELIMRFADGMMAFPSIIVALLAVTIWGPGRDTVLAAIALGNIPIFIRLTRAQIAKVKQEAYIEAAHAAGASGLRIILWHVLPNISPILTVQAAVSLAGSILAEASLSYLGVGIQPPAPSWGRMLREAQSFAGLAPWAVLAPGFFIAITVLGFNLLGDDLSHRR